MKQRPFDQYRKLVVHLPSAILHKAVIPCADGVSAQQAFEAFDTHGKVLPCGEPELLQAVLNAKEWLNLTVRMWCEDCCDCLIQVDEVRSWCEEMPRWVWAAFSQQLPKLAFERIGFVPRFLRV